MKNTLSDKGGPPHTHSQSLLRYKSYMLLEWRGPVSVIGLQVGGVTLATKPGVITKPRFRLGFVIRAGKAPHNGAVGTGRFTKASLLSRKAGMAGKGKQSRFPGCTKLSAC